MSERDFRPNDPDDVVAVTEDAGPEDLEAPEADAAEQRRDVIAHGDDQQPSVPYDVNPADAAEQHRVVEYDEDDYR